MKKARLSKEDHIALQMEVEILSQIDHPNVVKLYEVYEDSQHYYMILELMTGGELFDRIVEKDHFSEKEAADTIRPLVDALRYCHSMGIVHRDLKPENVLYANSDKDSIIKIADFGLARFFMSNELMMTQCGTPGYVAPEVIIGKGYDFAVDYWSLGIILYVLLCGFPPFYEEDADKLYALIKSGTFDFPSPYFDEVSDLAKDLIRKLLVVDPRRRIKAEEILTHRWLFSDDTSSKNLPSVLPGIKSLNARNRLRKATDAVVAVRRFASFVEPKKK
eukprot:TRINITY_DN12179_c0_g1_i2.p1 TRINITY_DN12179_c0_g1~~TRINITY_DN12179_c0_g1_i2.p1  ORF type:complete len:276 (-),score=51.51 TRINITY_DN12179_c0_g1_i2:129-956(-)